MIRQKMMTSKNSQRNFLAQQKSHLLIALLFVMTPLYADEPVNNLTNDDKVSTVFKSSPGSKPGSWVLSAEQWEFARHGESLLSLPVLNDVINSWFADRNKLIEIRYPGGEEGEFWVQELTDWLVSLAIPADRMITVAGSGSGDIIKFGLIKQ